MSYSARLAFGCLAMICLSACGEDGTTATRSLQPSEGSSHATATTTASADLQVSGSASSGSIIEGTDFTYTFQIKNAGPDSATGVTFTDVLPPGMIYRGADIGTLDLPCSQSGSTVTCSVGVIRKGAGLTLTFFVTAPLTTGSDTNTVTASADQSDPQPSNNTLKVVVQVAAPPAAGGGGGGGGGGGVKVVPVAAVGFSTLPADFVDGGYIIAGSGTGLAFPFVVDTGGTFTTLLVALDGNGSAGKAGFWLYADDPNNPGNPGALITSFFGPIPATGGALTSIPLPKASAPVLVAGQRYWLYCLGSAGELSAQWDLSTNVLLTAPVASGPPGSTPVVGPGQGRMPAFQIVVVH